MSTLVCRKCGSSVSKSFNTKLCRDCKREQQAEYVPTLEEIAAAMAVIRATKKPPKRMPKVHNVSRRMM